LTAISLVFLGSQTNTYTPELVKESEEIIENLIFCSCVLTARELGAKLPKGDARELIPNSPFPRVGGVVILRYHEDAHVAYIDKVTSEGLHVQEGNFEKCKQTERVIDFDDPNIVGYWHADI